MTDPTGGDLPDGLQSLPLGWTLRPLGDLVEPMPGTIHPASFPDEVFDYYSIPAYQESRTPKAELGSAIRSPKNLVEAGTTLFGKLNPRVPKVWLVEGSERRKICSTELVPLVPSPQVDSVFLYYLCWSDAVLPRSQELVSGSTPSRQRVDVRAFLRLQVPVPPLPQQRLIASALSSVQRTREAASSELNALDTLLNSMLQELMTGRRGLRLDDDIVESKK